MGNEQVQDTARYHSAILPEGESKSLILFYKLGASASEWRRACSATAAVECASAWQAYDC
jgi:hypothetical protein